MPRDLATLATQDSSSSMPEITKSPEAFDDHSSSSSAAGAEHDEPSLEAGSLHQDSKRDELHPYVQGLTESDVDSCTLLEEQAFPPQERCTREKVSGFSFLLILSVPAWLLEAAAANPSSMPCHVACVQVSDVYRYGVRNLRPAWFSLH
nr:hypothetical protein CFP56_20875 [Quercus suber]